LSAPLKLHWCPACKEHRKHKDLVTVRGLHACRKCGTVVKTEFNAGSVKPEAIRELREDERLIKYKRYNGSATMLREVAARLSGRDFKYPQLPSMPQADRSALNSARWQRRLENQREARRRRQGHVPRVSDEARVSEEGQLPDVRGDSLHDCINIQG
jgi:transcription initiation factor TFIIIB Brf1 subunit/transcription initiation factor TFIIB